MKGVDVYNNWKQNSAMGEAMNVLIDNDRKFHERMMHLEDNVGLIQAQQPQALMR